MNTLYVNLNDVNITRKFPIEALRPKTKGAYDKIVFIGGTCNVPFIPTEAASEYTCQDGAVLELIQFVNKNDFVFINMNFKSLVLYTCSRFSILNSTCGFDTASSGIRLGLGTNNFKIHNNTIVRTSAPNSEDCIAILISNGYKKDSTGTWVYMPVRDGIINGNIVGGCWTDSVQLCHTQWNLYGEVLNVIFENNLLYHDKKFLRQDGTYPDHMEQAGWDLKTGGTPENPVIFRNNTVIGARPSARNSRGYATCVQNMATDIQFINNHLLDCYGGVSLSQPRTWEPYNCPQFNRNLYFEGNTWEVQDYVIYSRETAVFKNDIFRADNLYELEVIEYRSPRQFIDCKFEPGPKVYNV